MATFYDDFERANGALGANWATQGTSGTITSGSVAYTSGWINYVAGITEGGRHEASAHIYRPASGTQYNGIYVKGVSSSSNCYFLHFTDAGPTPTLKLRRGQTYGGTELDTYTFTSNLAPYCKLSLVWEEGHLSGYVDDVLLVEADDATYATNDRLGMGGSNNNSVIADFRAVGGAAVQLDITPDVVGNYGSAVTLTATGTGTAWTSGTPGSPAFTCNHGTITAQTVNSTTEATLTFDPGDYLGAVTFTDPDNGTTDTIVVTSDVGVIPPGGTFLSQEAIDYIERSAIAETNPTIANREMDVHQAGAEVDFATALGELHLAAWKNDATIQSAPNTANALYLLWRLINGGYDPPTGPFTEPTSVPLAHALDFLRERWATTVDPWTVDQLVTALGGDPLASHQDILTALDGLEVTTDLQPVLDAIAAMQGDPLATIKAVLDYLFAMRTVSEWTLGDVKSWIEAVRGTDQPTIANVMAKLALIQAGGLPSLNDIDEHLSTFGAVVTAIDLVLGAQNKLPGTMAYILDDVYDIVFGLQNATPPTLSTNLWPGEDNVTLGTEVALTDGLVITGPLNGVLLTITGYPVRTQKYEFGAINSWSRVGAVIFGTDRDDYERSQTFSLDRQILIPQTMESAASAVFRVNEGWEGTVRPWTRN